MCNINISSTAGNVNGIFLNANVSGTVTNTKVNVDTAATGVNATATGIVSTTTSTLIMKNCNVIADAKHEDAGGSSPHAMGVQCCKDSYLYNCTVVGTHSGISASGTYLYIDGGKYSSPSHGGIYTSATENYIQNATVSHSKYTGKYIEEHDAIAHVTGILYVGGGTEASCSNNSVYLYKCKLISEVGTAHLVSRGTSDETNNKIYVSDSQFSNAGVRADANNFVYVGSGNNITEAQATGLGTVDFTNESYKNIVQNATKK